MAAPRSDELLALARALDANDSDVAARIETVFGLIRRVDDVRSRAQDVARRLDAVPGEIERAETAVREAEAAAARARAELEEAASRSREIERSRRAGADAKAEAERALRRATVASVDAEGAVARLHERRAELDHDATALRAVAEGLTVESRALAGEVGAVPRLSESGRVAPGASLREIDEWGARAHAALFVVRGSLESERERLVHEANTLAAAVLGDQFGGMSVGLVRRRIEAAYAG